MFFRDEDLISYLLGDAEPELSRRIEAALGHDAMLVRRLEELQSFLGCLDDYAAPVEPPADLISRTLRRIDRAHLPEDDSAKPSSAQSAKNPSLGKANDSSAKGHDTVQLRSAAWADDRTARRNRWDMVVLSLSVLVLCGLLLPTLLRARFESRRIQCAYNLYSLGTGLIQLASTNPERRFPEVPLEGIRSFAGTYAIELKDAQLLESASQLSCPSVINLRTVTPWVDVPSGADFHSASAEQQDAWRRVVGGDYWYSLGYTEDGRVRAPRLSGRATFAILADGAELLADGETLVPHEGRGMNIFFEDGHAEFICVPLDNSAGKWRIERIDHPFKNLRGLRAVGLAPHDAALGPSALSPLGEEKSLR